MLESDVEMLFQSPRMLVFPIQRGLAGDQCTKAKGIRSIGGGQEGRGEDRQVLDTK